jgi:hypothetical protein
MVRSGARGATSGAADARMFTTQHVSVHPPSSTEVVPTSAMNPFASEFRSTGAIPKSTNAAQPTQVVHMNFVKAFSDVLLPTATVLVKGPAGVRRVLCLVDIGSQRTFIRRELARVLQIPIVESEELMILGFGSDRAPECGQFNRSLVTKQGTFEGARPINVQALEKPDTFCGEAPVPRGQLFKSLIRRKFRLGDERALDGESSATQLDILIGADYERLIVTGYQVCPVKLPQDPSWVGSSMAQSTTEPVTGPKRCSLPLIR